MADIEFIKGEFGDNYDITIKDKDGNVVDLTGFSGATLTIKTLDRLISKLSKTLTILTPATDGKVRWAITSGDTAMDAGDYIGQIKLTSGSVVRKVYELTVRVGDSLA